MTTKIYKLYEKLMDWIWERQALLPEILIPKYKKYLLWENPNIYRSVFSTLVSVTDFMGMLHWNDNRNGIK